MAVSCYVIAFVMILVAMFGNVDGGNKDPKTWFPWHPVLMMLGFPSLMSFGRHAYVTKVLVKQ